MGSLIKVESIVHKFVWEGALSQALKFIERPDSVYEFRAESRHIESRITFNQSNDIVLMFKIIEKIVDHGQPTTFTILIYEPENAQEKEMFFDYKLTFDEKVAL